MNIPAGQTIGVSPVSRSSAPSPGAAPGHGVAAVDLPALQSQWARSIEDSPTDLSAFLDLLRRLLRAEAIGWVKRAGDDLSPDDCVRSSRPGAAAALLSTRTTLEVAQAAAHAMPQAGPGWYTLCAPVEHERSLRGWLVAQLVVRDARDLQPLLVLLQTAAGHLLYARQRNATAQIEGALERASGLLEAFRLAGSEHDFERACRRAVDLLSEELICARVVLGYRRRGKIRIQAISAVAKLDWKSAEHQPLEAALEEAVHTGRSVHWSPGAPAVAETAAHALYGRPRGAARLLTIPFRAKRGAILLEWSAGSEAAEEVRAGTAAAAFVPVLFELLERARPHLLLYRLHRGWRSLSAARRRTTVGALAAVALLMACPFPYAVKIGCRLAPVTKRVVAAPFQGQLRHSLVRPGDRVEAGQTLGELDSRELKMKESELLAARDKALKQRDRALANQGEGADFATAQVAGLEAQSVAQELALVQRKLALLEVRAPLAGTVVSGDLRRAEGQPVQQGQVLWEVAPLEEMIVELEVPDRDVSHVRAGQAVSIHLEAFAGGSWASAIERIHPQSEAAEGRNVFLAEAPIRHVEGAELRPGMRGRASISTGFRPLGWILGHRLWEWLVTTLLW